MKWGALRSRNCHHALRPFEAGVSEHDAVGVARVLCASESASGCETLNTECVDVRALVWPRRGLLVDEAAVLAVWGVRTRVNLASGIPCATSGCRNCDD